MVASIWSLLLIQLASASAFAVGGGSVNGALAPRVMAAASFAPPAAASRNIIMKEKKDVLELEGVVLEALKGANFRVQLDDSEQVILAHVSGKIRKNFIKILVGDHVTCELSPYDLTKGAGLLLQLAATARAELPEGQLLAARAPSGRQTSNTVATHAPPARRSQAVLPSAAAEHVSTAHTYCTYMDSAREARHRGDAPTSNRRCVHVPPTLRLWNGVVRGGGAVPAR